MSPLSGETPAMARSADRVFGIVLHDVAPSSWPSYGAFIRAIDAIGGIPLTHLVVPDFHGQGSIVHDRGFRAAMDDRLARGDELLLHGFRHADEAPPPRTPRDLFMRRIYTHEGEFQAVDEAGARSRILQGLEAFARCGWATRGFVAPAWLLSAAAQRELAATGLDYTSDPRHLVRLPDWRRFHAPSLVWSARSGWRRALSRAFNDRLLRRHANATVLRLGLHPVDMRHESVLRWWLDVVEALLETRRPVTKSQAFDRLVADDAEREEAA